jgi:UDP-N-acetylmuramyl pentapeptide phosphotransferase/UDP-N-acetylglucosamine-1-phosphate transferase
LIIQLSKKLGLTDKPNERKVHVNPIPNLGGIAIFLGFFISTLGWLIAYGSVEGINYAVIVTIYGLIVLFVMGIIDDQIEMRASHKFLIQIAVAIALAASGIRIDTFNGIFFIYELPVFVQYLFTVLLLVGLINAFNLIDGIDGLAGGISFINALVIGVGLYNPNEILTSFIAFGLAGALLGFLKYNFNPAKIFMGDTGSLVIGYLMAVLGILLLNRDKVVLSDKDVVHTTETTILVVGILVLPVYDTIRVFASRIAKGGSPFKPDKTHAHHLLISVGFNHKKSAIILYIANSLIIAVAFFYFLMFNNSVKVFEPIREWLGIVGNNIDPEKIMFRRSLFESLAIISLFGIAAIFYDFRRIYIALKLLFIRKKESEIVDENVLLDDE